MGAWFDWIEEHPLGEAATVAVAAGITVGQALAAYGADPRRPRPAPPDDPHRPGMAWVDGDTVLVVAVEGGIVESGVVEGGVVEGGIVAVEPNGWEGSRPEVLRRLSAGGRAASWYFNVNAVRRLAIADRGRILVGFEPGIDETPDDEVLAAALDGFDIEEDWRRGRGLEVLRRVVGHGFTREVFERMLATGLRYPIVPRPDDDELRGTPGPDDDELRGTPGPDDAGPGPGSVPIGPG